ncbi:hypothetical protein [Endozoicomonas euniceicola]|uniref:Uncharacterized protein n=1 Tax=Endozoicomonas euniceicola TaxID=1234143 RepID=A0ABY6GZK9_9GAMM|nr:hypothetical protein [Endozoicomonas euniceicola]UYM18243.1 hypothetical protein NX720_10170 [Endozoicomonas euniceicola]
MAKAYDGEFIDEHFAQDSALVLLNGAVFSAGLEFICHKVVRTPGDQGRVFCLHFAPELTSFLYLIKSQWPTGNIKVWSHLNTAFFAGMAVCILNLPEFPKLSALNMRWAVTYMIYPHVAQMMADTAAHYSAESNQTNSMAAYVLFGVASTIMVMISLFQWHEIRQAFHYSPEAVMITSAGTALISTFFYLFLQSLDEVSNLEQAGAVAVAVAVAEAGALVVATAVAKYGVIPIPIIPIPITIPSPGVGAFFGAGNSILYPALVGVVCNAEALTLAAVGAGAGVAIIALTGSIAAALSQAPAMFSVNKGLTTIVAAGLPLMVTSWLASLNRFVKVNATAHETMQSIFIPSLPELKIFYPEN